MSEIKYKKCPECGGKMMLRKSHSKGTKFWGCTSWKDTGCNGSMPYFGDGARAGVDFDIREIDNGYIITTSVKYALSIDDETSTEIYCDDKKALKLTLQKLMVNEVTRLCDQIESSTEFTDEVDESKHKVRVKSVNKGTKDVNELLKKIKKSRKEAEKMAKNGDNYNDDPPWD